MKDDDERTRGRELHEHRAERLADEALTQALDTDRCYDCGRAIPPLMMGWCEACAKALEAEGFWGP